MALRHKNNLHTKMKTIPFIAENNGQ